MSLFRRVQELSVTSQTRQPLRPRLEVLEDRCTPSTVTLGTMVGGYLRLEITGSDWADCVTILQDDAANTLTVIDPLFTKKFESDKIAKIEIDLKGGNDCLTYVLNSDFQHFKEVQADLGWGNDRAVFTSRKVLAVSRGQDYVSYLAIHGFLGIRVHARQGMDTVETDLGSVADGSVYMDAYLGDGDDQFSAKWHGDIGGDWYDWDPGIVDYQVQGGNGNDRLSVQALADTDGSDLVYANGGALYTDGSGIDIGHYSRVSMVLFGETDNLNEPSNGETSNDLIEARFSGVVQGTFYERLHGGRGNDELLMDTTLRDGTYSNAVQAFAYGGADDDKVAGKLHVAAQSWDPWWNGFRLEGGTGYDSVFMYGDTGKMSYADFECIYSDDWGMVLP